MSEDQHSQYDRHCPHIPHKHSQPPFPGFRVYLCGIKWITVKSGIVLVKEQYYKHSFASVMREYFPAVPEKSGNFIFLNWELSGNPGIGWSQFMAWGRGKCGSWHIVSTFVSPLESTGNYSATSNEVGTLAVDGGLLPLVQRGGYWAGPQPAQALPRCTKCNSQPING